MSSLSRQEFDLFTHACCRVTYGWDEAYPRTLSPLVTQGVIFTDSRAHFVPLRSCVMGQIGGNNCLALPKAHLCKTTQTEFYHWACRNLKINQECEWGAQVLGGTAPAGLLDLVYMRCLDTRQAMCSPAKAQSPSPQALLSKTDNQRTLERKTMHHRRRQLHEAAVSASLALVLLRKWHHTSQRELVFSPLSKLYKTQITLLALL